MKTWLSVFCFLISTWSFGQDAQYKVEIDINHIVEDQVKVRVFPPALESEKAVYNMPKIIPGTYDVSDFGQFVHSMIAIDTSGNELAIEKLDVNRWEIDNAPSLSHITYLVDDSYDEPRGAGIFEPAGTNIDANANVVLNPFGFSGYFEGTKHLPQELHVTKPANFYGETSMQPVSKSDSLDIFHAKNYYAYHDAPILYAAADTASVMVAGARIAVAVYSPNGVISATDIMNEVEGIFPAAAEYLGGNLPVDRYSILVYLTEGASGTGAFGALEHMTSTVFVLPEAPMTALGQTFRDVTAHEFFHIVTPLNIHSEEIHDYDFMNPQMSEHLWLYEGCTEYAAQHVQVKNGDMDLDTFLSVMKQKMATASQYDSGIAFTEMSKKALGEHASQYGNVYEQGALIGMALDLKLRALSGGNYGTQELMRDLSAEYGVEKPFKDEELFSEIARISGQPEIEAFLEKHVAGTEPLPFAELLAPAGIYYAEQETKELISGGNIAIGYNPDTENLIVMDTKGLDSFGQDLGFKEGDQLVEWNGSEVTIENLRDILDAYRAETEVGDKVIVKVLREKKGKEKVVKLKGKAIMTTRTSTDVLVAADISELTPEQKAFRKAWINK